MASISISGSPSTTNNSITINYTTSGISNITNVQLSKDGGSNYINPMSFSNTSATFNVGDWSNGTYSNCVLKVTYTDTSGGTGTTTIPCTGITLSSNSLTFTNNNSQRLTATVTPSNTTDTVSWSTNSSSVATVSNGVVTPQSNGSATITASCGNYSAYCSVTVNIATTPSSYTITYNLSNCYISNTNSSIAAGSQYYAYLTPNNGYTLGRITLTMGGVDITAECASGDAIYIGNVTGNIVINCTATQTSSGGGGSTGGGTVSNESSWADGVPYTFDWVNGEYVSSSSGEFKIYDSDSRTPKLYCYGASTIEVTSNSSYQYNAWYTSNGTFIENFVIPGTFEVPSNAYYFAITSKEINKSSVTITPHS